MEPLQKRLKIDCFGVINESEDDIDRPRMIPLSQDFNPCNYYPYESNFVELVKLLYNNHYADKIISEINSDCLICGILRQEKIYKISRNNNNVYYFDTGYYIKKFYMNESSYQSFTHFNNCYSCYEMYCKYPDDAVAVFYK